MGKRMFLAVIAMFLVAVTVDAQQPYFVAPGGAGLQHGRDWINAAPSINSIVGNMQGVVEVFVKGGVYGPVQISNTNITDIRIYGHCAGFELDPGERDLYDQSNRTLIEGFYDGTTPSPYFSPALSLAIDAKGKAVIDGFFLRGFGSQESLALRILHADNVMVNRCRFVGSNGTGSLITNEGLPDGNRHVAIINSVIAQNTCTYIAECMYGMKFINTTIADNQCDDFMNLIYNYHDVYEIMNSIVWNTHHFVHGYWPVDVYSSLVEDITGFNGVGSDNIVGVTPPFITNGIYRYACHPNEYTTDGGRWSYFAPYSILLEDSLDIIGSLRFDEGHSIDMGAYQLGKIDPTEQSVPYNVDIDGPDIYSPLSLSIYPTHIGSGETLYFEKNGDNSLTARIYSPAGIEVSSVSLTSAVEALPLSCPAGVYIVVVTDDSTGGRILQAKITVR